MDVPDNNKMRCRRCCWFNYNFLFSRYEVTDKPFCGLHGGARVNPDGKQQNLNGRGGCGFWERVEAVQLELFDWNKD